MGIGGTFRRVRRPRCEVDHSPASTANVKNVLTYASTPPYVFMAWYLVKHREDFTFTFIPALDTGTEENHQKFLADQFRSRNASVCEYRTLYLFTFCLKSH
jgi:hypothetical protein